MKSYIFLIAAYLIINLSTACTDKRFENIILDTGIDVTGNEDILEISDTTSDTQTLDSGNKSIYVDKPFIQYEAEIYDMETSVNSIVEFNNKLILGRDDGLYILNEGKTDFLSIFGNQRIIKLFNLGNIIAAIGDNWAKIGDEIKIESERDFIKTIKYSTTDGSRLIIGFENNQYEIYENDQFYPKSFDTGFDILGLCYTENHIFFLSIDAIYRGDKEQTGVEKIMDGKFKNIDCARDDVLVATADDGFVIYKNGDIERVSREVNIPYPILKSTKYTEDGVFALSEKGLMLLKEDKTWDYFHSRYYIPSWDINDVIKDSSGDFVIGTSKGIGIIKRKSMKFSDKEKILYDGMRTRHNRMGFYSPCGLKKAGDLTTTYTFDNDNDGQWSGMYLATMCFKYVVTKDESVLNDARETLDALLLLETVTGKKGFFARSVVEPELCEQKQNGEGEWHLSEDKKWCFKGDTSSDEYVGHVFGLSIYYDYCASQEEKERIKSIHSELQRYIVLNGYQIVDLDGKVTTHGQFNPEWIKSTGQFGDAGLNSAMILGGLRFAYHMTEDKFFEEHFYKLAKEERYFDYVRRIEDINTAVQINHDSEEMSFLALFTLLRLEYDEKFKKYWYEGLENIYQTQIKERNPEFNMMYAFFNPRNDYHLDDSIRTLKEFYTHGIEWKVYNSHRSDYKLDPRKDRFGREQSLEVFSYNQKRAIRWAENPFVLDEDGEGYSEQILTSWLLPYWMGRFIGVIK